MGGSCQKLFKFCLLAAAAGFFLMAGGASAGGCARGRMPQGTSIGGVDVSGLRPGEACAAVSESLRQELEGLKKRCAGKEPADIMTLKELERKIERIRPQRLVVLARTHDGAEKEMGIDELIETKGEFIRVLRGNDLSDVDILLRYEVPDCVIE